MSDPEPAEREPQQEEVTPLILAQVGQVGNAGLVHLGKSRTAPQDGDSLRSCQQMSK